MILKRSLNSAGKKIKSPYGLYRGSSGMGHSLVLTAGLIHVGTFFLKKNQADSIDIDLGLSYYSFVPLF